VTWRATKLRTKTGNFVVVPNNVVAKEAIINYSEPALPTRLEVEVGATYLAQPNAVKAAILEAMGNAPLALKSPAPDVLLVAFADSAITYRARFWVDDYERDEVARNQVRTAIYYAFSRHGIEIPWPITVEYKRDWPEPDVQGGCRERERVLAAVDLFSLLDEEHRRGIAAGSVTRHYGNGDTIVRQGDAGDSMYVVCSGTAVVTLEHGGAAGQEIAAIAPAGYFGEMSLLTGEPRSATVIARGDTTLIEIGADLFRRLASLNPLAVEQIGVTVVSRRAELEAAKAAAPGSGVLDVPATFRTRMKKFLRMA
jgi:CRP-like cAMP-binding protein